MLGRHIRHAGVQFIETSLAKLATNGIYNPSQAQLKREITLHLGGAINTSTNTPTATAVVPKVVSTPST